MSLKDMEVIEIKEDSVEESKEKEDDKNVELYHSHINPKYTIICGVDFGEVNFYVAIFCKELGVMIDFLQFTLRIPKQPPDLMEMRNMLSYNCNQHKKLWRVSKRIFYEVQFNGKLVSLQDYFRDMTCRSKCVHVTANSMRAAYREHFDSTQGLSKYKSRKLNKANAISYGRNFLTKECKDKLVSMGLYDNHDVFDALLFAKYGCEFKMKE